MAAAVDLRYILDRTEPGGELPVEDEPRRVSVPDDIPDRGAAGEIVDHLLPVFLKPSEKRALDLISDWPWIALTDLAGILGVSPPRATQLVNPLEGFKLVERPRHAGGRLALTDRGLTLLARKGPHLRRRGEEAVEHRSPGRGRPIRVAQRHRRPEPTVAQEYGAHRRRPRLPGRAHRAGPFLGWEIEQLDPPRRASRHFRHDERMRAVNPDAFGVLRKDGKTWPFFLEWERRAVRPSTMSARLAPYLRYYSSHRPIDDHGTRPSVLVVFDDEIAHTHFLRVAREEMRAERVTVPLWVSHKAAIDTLGPLGRAWRTPGDWQSLQALPPL